MDLSATAKMDHGDEQLATADRSDDSLIADTHAPAIFTPINFIALTGRIAAIVPGGLATPLS